VIINESIFIAMISFPEFQVDKLSLNMRSQKPSCPFWGNLAYFELSAFKNTNWAIIAALL
jgi:hypothetical protein